MKAIKNLLITFLDGLYTGTEFAFHVLVLIPVLLMLSFVVWLLLTLTH